MPAQSWSWGVWFLKLEFDIFVLLKPWKHYVITKPTHFFSTVTKLFIIFSKTCQISQILDIIFTIVLNYKWSHHSYCHSNSKKGTTLIIGDIQIWFVSIPFIRQARFFLMGNETVITKYEILIRFFWLLVFILLITVSYTDVCVIWHLISRIIPRFFCKIFFGWYMKLNGKPQIYQLWLSK